MFKFHRMAIVFLFVAVETFLGCNNKENPFDHSNNTVRQDTSIFIGTWIAVFDTSDDRFGTKEAKQKYWGTTDGSIRDFCGNPPPMSVGLNPGQRCEDVEPFSFVNDTCYINLGNTLSFNYTYDKDSIYFFRYDEETNERDYSYYDATSYKYWNDSLTLDPIVFEKMVFNPDGPDFFQTYTCTILYIRVSNEPTRLDCSRWINDPFYEELFRDKNRVEEYCQPY